MKNKGLAILSTLIALLMLTSVCIAEEEPKGPLDLSFTYAVPMGYDAVAGVNPDTGIEKLIITNEEQGTLITMMAVYNEAFVGMDLKTLYEERVEGIIAVVYNFGEDNVMSSQIVVDEEGNDLFIEMIDDELTIIQYVDLNPENGLLFFYGVQNTKGEGLTDEQLIVFDEVLASIAFSEG